jgi:hypothetical protein
MVRFSQDIIERHSLSEVRASSRSALFVERCSKPLRGALVSSLEVGEEVGHG